MNMVSNYSDAADMFIYWMAPDDFEGFKKSLPGGLTLKAAMLTPCEVMKSTDNTVFYASPATWSRICVRQGSWYRDSDKMGKYLVVAPKALPLRFNRFFEATLSPSNFVPESLPSMDELQGLIEDENYTDNRPDQWENKGLMDAVMFKVLFTLNGFWRIGDNLKKHWLSHKANHANYLTHTFSTEIDGDSVPYSIAENAGICSSCVEFFNVIDEGSRKLVRSCPGAVTFGRAKKDIYYDVNPSTRHL